MVLECRSADTGVGATMAPSSHEEKGSWADFVMPAKARSAAGRSTAPLFIATRRVHLDSELHRRGRRQVQDGAREGQAAEDVEREGEERLGRVTPRCRCSR